MAAATQNGYTNGINGTHGTHPDITPLYPRFSDIPSVIDIPVGGNEGDEEAVSLSLTELPDDSDELCDLLTAENAARSFWVTIALAYAKQDRIDVAIEILQKGLEAMRRDEDRLKVLGVQCWLELWKCRQAPRVKPTAQKDGLEERDERTKEVWLHKATTTLNEASRISPSFPPLFLARGTLYLLRASLQPSKSSSAGGQEHSERADTLKNALKCFDDALRVSSGKDIFALLGKAKAQYSLNNIPAALALYQQALERAPDMIDPDPRVGVGVCLWTLGHKDLASQAWKRSLELNPESKIANVLMGLSLLSQANKFDPSTPEFEKLYREAITSHIQASFKADNMYALTCATFAPYFVQRKHWVNVERLARRAIENTDVNAIASDGWFLLARKDHYNGELGKAAEHYNKADQARGGEDKGWVPAKFGGAQLRVAQGDFDGAKFRLEKMVEKANARSSNVSGAANVEAMTLLGILHAENVFNAQASGSKEDTSQDARKAIAQLEQVRIAWKDAKRNVTADPAVLLNLARLYETEAPEKALQCLQEVERLQLTEMADPELPWEEMTEEEIEEERRIRRELLPPQLLNNIGCFHFQGEKYAEAREDFQMALNACVKQGDRLQQENGEGVDGVVDATDALVSTISFNLARTYEAEGIDEEARKVYAGLLERHPDYIDARTRIAYLTLKSDPEKGADEIKALLDSDPGNLDVRALYGYYVHGVKKRTLALNEDAEQRHYKHTLQTYDKHDLYSLTGMGNLHLVVAREMPRETDQHKEKRSRMYGRAVEFFDKVLALDPKSAFAAQGMGIAIVEEKKDSAAGIQIFSKVRESVKESSVYVNLGHVFTEVKQYSRAIENYELALAKSQAQGGKRDPGILACLGRVWLIRGRQEKKLEAYKTALDISRQALDAAPENINFRFNVAFVQIQLAQMINTLPESAKSLADVEAAAEGLDDAIEEFVLIAKEPNPPFPRSDIEQRASMGRNTMKKQMATALERQKEYEERNRERLEEARRKRDEAAAAREAQRLAEEQRQEEERKRLKEERERIAEEDRMLIERRLEEEKAKEAEMWTTDEETGERRKREKKPKEKKRKKKHVDSDEEVDGGTDAEGRKSKPRSGATTATQSDAEGGRRKKKRRLESRKGRAQNSKYKSKDIVEDSSEDDGAGVSQPAEDEASAVETPAGTPGADTPSADTPGGGDMFGEDEEVVQRATQRKKVARILDDDEEDEDDDAGAPAAGDSDHGGDGLGGDD